MTLVLSCVTSEAAVQVSDRRLTFPNGGLADDKANKAVVYCGHFAIGYSGLAQLGGKNPGGLPGTDWWLTEQLQPGTAPPREAFNELAKSATDAVAASGARGDLRRTSFAAVGWERSTSEVDALEPKLYVISNHEDADGISHPVKNDFVVSTSRLVGKQPYAWWSVGVPLSDAERNIINRAIKRGVKKSPGVTMQVMAAAIRDVARRTESVGKDLMAAILPASAVPGDGISLPLDPATVADDQVSCHYLPENASQVSYAPNTVCGGMSISRPEV